MGLAPHPLEEHYSEFLARIHPEDRDPVAKMIAESIEGDGQFRGTFRFVWPDGSIHWVESRAAPPRDSVTAWLRNLVETGVEVMIGDPGRSYLPKSGLQQVTRHRVPTSLELEDRTERETVIWRLLAQ